MSLAVATITIGAACGAALSPIAARYAARRSTAQKLPYDAEAERFVLAAGQSSSDVADLLHTAGVRARHFALPQRSQAWFDLAGGDPEPPGDRDPDAADAIGALKDGHPELLEHAVRLVSSHDDRTLYKGAQDLEAVDGDPPLRRSSAMPSPARYGVAAAWMAIGGAVVGAVTDSPLIALILLATVAYGYICAAIDHDTLYIDMPTFVAGSIGLWAAAAIAAAVGQVPWSWVVLGAGTVAGWAVVLEATNRLYRLIRQRDGMGFGDTLIAVVTVGIPTALTGSLMVGIYSVIAAGVLAVIVMVPIHIIKKFGRTTPFAFGPFLAVGWIPALLLHIYTGFGGL